MLYMAIIQDKYNLQQKYFNDGSIKNKILIQKLVIYGM